MNDLSGEELLAMTILGGRKDRKAVERELDRRSSMLPPAGESSVGGLNWAPVRMAGRLQVA